jgi:hypothetical protein
MLPGRELGLSRWESSDWSLELQHGHISPLLEHEYPTLGN